jgi:hypothetical protein
MSERLHAATSKPDIGEQGFARTREHSVGQVVDLRRIGNPPADNTHTPGGRIDNPPQVHEHTSSVISSK